MTTTPRWIKNLKAIWAIVFLCACAMDSSVGLVKKLFRPSANGAHGIICVP